MALIHVASDSQIVVRHWAEPAPDLKAWAKESGLARTGVGVTFVNAKTSHAVVYEDGQDILLYGERVGGQFPWGVYAAKYERRHGEEGDDADAAPASFSNFEWQGSPHERLGWRVLKAVWNAERANCQNCDTPLMLIGFGWQMGMLSYRSGMAIRHCRGCRRRFVAAVEEPLAWLAEVLPPFLRPTHLRLWAAILIDWSRLSLDRGRVVQVADSLG